VASRRAEELSHGPRVEEETTRRSEENASSVESPP
jgi:hypothetical protein